MDLKQIANDIMSPKRAAKQWYPHDRWIELRALPTLVRLEPNGMDPFWAVVKHADISEISTQPDKFLSAPRTIIMPKPMEMFVRSNPARGLINLDPPEHRDYRKIVNPWFVPRNIKKLEDRMRASAVDLVDMMASAGTWQGDFVFDIAAIHPVRLITHLLGLPDEDEQYLIKMANETFGMDDPEFMRKEGGLAGILESFKESQKYFDKLTKARRENPTDDLASVIVHAEIGGKLIPPHMIFGYFIIILTAGHETTRTAMAGGMNALLDNPGELRKLQKNPALVDSAVEEMIRWTSPVNQFGRTAAVDYELRGVTIKAGESVGMFYGSANRDEEVFDNPFEFRVDRDPNPHLGFGIGEHFCLGASLARLEMKVFFDEFIRRVDVESVERTGNVEYSATNFVGGVKHLPMRCRVAKAAA